MKILKKDIKIEEKKQKKNKIKKEEEKKLLKERIAKIEKLNKSSKIILYILLGIILLNIIFIIISFLNSSFSLFYTNYIVNTITGILFSVSSFIPYFSWIYSILSILIVIVVLIVQLIITNNKKLGVRKLNKRYNIVIKVYMIILFVIIFPTILDIQQLSLPIIDEIMFKDTINKTYKNEDLEKYLEYSLGKVEYYAETLKRDKEQKVVFNGDFNTQAVKDLKNVKDKLPLLKGLYPRKSYDLTDSLKSIVGNDTIGLTHLYNIYADFEMESVSVLSTMIHEYCHTKSLIRENETVLCSYIAGINSDSDVSKYGAYLEGYSRALVAYSYLDIEKSLEYEDRFNSLCKLDNYYEICNYYLKQNEYYLDGSYEIFLRTRSLKNYIDNKYDLMKVLNNLKINGYKLTSEITTKEVSLEEIDKLIDSESYDTIIVSGKLDEKKFNKIKKFIEDDDIFLSIYQNNYEQEISEVQQKNPKRFFLEPIEKDYKTISRNKIVREFTYERVARLLLEYHEKYGY